MLAGGVLAAVAGQLVRRGPRAVQYLLRIVFASILVVIDQMRKSAEIAVVAVAEHSMPLLQALQKPGVPLVAVVIAALVVRFTFR